MAVDIMARGVAATKVGLEADGKISSKYLPSYVDDVIDLLNVSAAAPEHCTTGDKYYNTSTKLIYTATATDTWGTEGASPEKGKIYVNTSATPSISYRWDGTSLVEIGQDLSDYVKFTDYAASNEAGVIKIDANTGTTTDSTGALKSITMSKATYESADNATFLSKGTAENVYAKNIATGNYSVTIEGTATQRNGATNVGVGSVSDGYRASSYGNNASATAQEAIAIGFNAVASAQGAVQIGAGTNSTAGTIQFGSNQLLDSSKVKTAQSTTAGEIYDVTYINSMIGNIESLLGGI